MDMQYFKWRLFQRMAWLANADGISSRNRFKGNILTPVIMSKRLNLHPVVIIVSLLVFGHFFGIIGMLLATPICALIKILFVFFDEKYGIFNYQEESLKKISK